MIFLYKERAAKRIYNEIYIVAKLSTIVYGRGNYASGISLESDDTCTILPDDLLQIISI